MWVDIISPNRAKKSGKKFWKSVEKVFQMRLYDTHDTILSLSLCNR